jgi:nucleotide-binding universal stress UspA family protein
MDAEVVMRNRMTSWALALVFGVACGATQSGVKPRQHEAASHGRGGLARMVSGSVAQDVVQRARRPVFVVRSG